MNVAAAFHSDILSGPEIARMMRMERITIRQLAARMGVSLVRVRAVRKEGVIGSAYCMDWTEAITGIAFQRRR